MPVQVEWDNDEHSIIRLKFEGKWVLEELYPALAEMYRLMGAEDHTVDGIVDMTHASTLPSNILSIRGTIERNKPTNRGLTAIAGANTLIRSMSNILNRVRREDSDYIFTTTVEEARQAILKVHQSEVG